MSHRDYLPDPLAQILDAFGGHFCEDCHLQKEPERKGEKLCLLCQKALDDHYREAGRE